MLPLFLFCFWLQIYHYFCSWTAVAGSFGCYFGGFFSCSATLLLSKISTPLETCVGQKLILIQVRPTCYSLVLSFMYIFFITCLQKHARSFARVCKLQCACRESNPGHKHGSLVCCRYTTGALVHEIFLDLLVLFSFLKALRASYFLFPIVKWLQTRGLCSICICQLAVWSSGMILPPGAGGPGFNSQNSLASFTGKC